MESIKIELTRSPRQKPADRQIPFGKIFSDHMFIMNYNPDNCWHNPRIVPYGPIELEPSCMVLHYAQEIFEGLKAYKSDDGNIRLFRPWDNFKRMNVSCERMNIPPIDVDFAVEATKKLVDIDREWVPESADSTLYIRPFIFATDNYVGVKASSTYMFMIIMSPSGSYYPEGINPVGILIESEDVRSVKGGTGYVKTGGNYAASIRAGERASDKGYSQVLWLDGVERKYIEEVGAMNVFFKIGDEVVTPALEGSILAGITRNSCIALMKSWGVQVSERRLSVDELINAAASGELQEAFGSGTAAVVSPIGCISYQDKEYSVNQGKMGTLSQRLYDELTGIQWGRVSDTFKWTIVV